MKSVLDVKYWSMAALVFFMCVFAVCFAAGKEPPGPEDAFIDGSGHAYYGKDQGGWRELRKEYMGHELYGRQGQRQILYVLDGHPSTVISLH